MPHLSVAAGLTDAELDHVAASLAATSAGKLPVSAMASEVALLDTTPGRWQVAATFPLAS